MTQQQQQQQQQQRQHQPALEELIQIASTTIREKVGRHRNPDGTLPGWYEWAASHPQCQQQVEICQGREGWEMATSSSQEKYGGGNTLSVISWNILSHTWFQKSKENETTYDHVPPQLGNWKERFRLFQKWITQLHPNILALQEVDYTKFDEDLIPFMEELGYCGLIQRPKKQSPDQPCATATFWDRTKFKMVEHASFSRSLCVILTADQGQSNEGTITSCNLPPTRTFCIANVHLESSQSDLGHERRARQFNSALAYASSRAAAVPGDQPLVICGDFNTGADNNLFRVLRSYRWHDHNMASAYEHPATAKTLPVNRATFMVPQHHYVIDQVLYSYETLRLRSVFNALSEEEIEKYLGPPNAVDRGLPNESCPSDHIPVGAIFEFVTQKAIDGSKSTSTITPKEELDLRQKERLEMEWEKLKAQEPPRVKGKPSADQIEERRVYAHAVKAWRKHVEETGDLAEVEFVASLIKRKKTAQTTGPQD